MAAPLARGQQPALYRSEFRRVAALLRAHTLYATMLWAMNDGGGYPFKGGHRLRRPHARPAPCCCQPVPSTAPPAGSPYSINCSDPARAADCQQLDTDGDGQLTSADDMYTPYYPGDDVVDWVGLSIYHFGHSYPYGNNYLPEPRKFASKVHASAKQPMQRHPAVHATAQPAASSSVPPQGPMPGRPARHARACSLTTTAAHRHRHADQRRLLQPLLRRAQRGALLLAVRCRAQQAHDRGRDGRLVQPVRPLPGQQQLQPRPGGV